MNAEADTSRPATAPTKRRRPALACVSCRRRKLRCDHAKPCNNCSKPGSDECVYPPTHTPVKQTSSRSRSKRSDGSWSRNRRSPSVQRVGEDTEASFTLLPSATNTPSSRVAQVQQQHQNGIGYRCAFVDRDQPLPPTPSSFVSAQNSQPAHGSARRDNVDNLLARISELEGTVARISGAKHQLQDDQNQTSKSNSSGQESNNLSGPRFGNQSSWMNSTSLYTKVLRPLSKVQYSQPELIRTLSSCKNIARRVEDSVSVQATAVGIGTRIPEKPVADQLVASYFEHFEGPFRVLHIPSFWIDYEKYWNRRDATPDVFVVQLQLCMALGSIAHPDALLWKNASSQWLIEAQAWLHHSFLRLKKPLTFEELQVACLTCLLEASVSGTDSIHHCWVQVGDLYRKAICFGLHRDPKTLANNMTVRRSEMRRRLWVTILELSLLLSMQAGRTPLISTLEYDACPPSNLGDDELIDRPISEAAELSEQSARPTSISVQLALHDSFNTRLTIISKFNGIKDDIDYDEILRLHSELTKSERHMQQRLNILAQDLANGAIPNSELTASHLLLSEVLISRYLLALHLPKLGQFIKNPAFHFSRRISIATSLKLAEACGILSNTKTRDGTRAPSAGFERLFVNSMGIFRHTAMPAVFATILELVTYKEEQADNEGALAVWCESELFQHLQSLEAWTANQLQAGTTDFRTFCYMRACIAYAKALDSPEGSQDTEKAIAQAALQSNESYCELMNGVAARLGLFTSPYPSTMEGVEAPVSSNVTAAADIPYDWIGGLLGDTAGNVELNWLGPGDASGDMGWYMSF